MKAIKAIDAIEKEAEKGYEKFMVVPCISLPNGKEKKGCYHTPEESRKINDAQQLPKDKAIERVLMLNDMGLKDVDVWGVGLPNGEGKKEEPISCEFRTVFELMDFVQSNKELFPLGLKTPILCTDDEGNCAYNHGGVVLRSA